MGSDGKKYLDEVIDFKTHIAPYFYIEINAGVGAGKSTWIENLITRGIDGHVPRILYITSRRAKVDETFETYKEYDEDSGASFSRSIGIIPEEAVNDEDTWESLDLKSVVCTNAFLAAYLKNTYDPRKVGTHIYNTFDIIVVDEVHSLVLDATYQDAPFYVQELIEDCISTYEAIHYGDERFMFDGSEMRCKHLIVMTGTPEAIGPLFLCGKTPAIRWNFMDKCKNVMPQRIFFVEKNVLNPMIAKMLRRGKRIVYYSNHTRTPDEVCQNLGIDKEVVVTSFSDDEKRKRLEREDPLSFARMIEVEKSLKENCLIPDSVKLFVTTARYKEGVNINNDVDVVFVEAHNQSDVVQMVGRVRKGVKWVVIVVDSEGFSRNIITENLEMSFAGDIVNPLNALWDVKKDEWRNKHKQESIDEQEKSFEMEKRKYVEFIESKSPFLKYSPIRGLFMFYDLKKYGNDYLDKSNALWERARPKESYYKLVEKWFPESTIQKTVVTAYKQAWDYWNTWNDIGIRVWDCSGAKVSEECKYTPEERDEIENGLGQIYNWRFKKLNKLLEIFSSYECKRGGKNKKGSYYYYFVDRGEE